MKKTHQFMMIWATGINKHLLIRSLPHTNIHMPRSFTQIQCLLSHTQYKTCIGYVIKTHKNMGFIVKTTTTSIKYEESKKYEQKVNDRIIFLLYTCCIWFYAVSTRHPFYILVKYVYHINMCVCNVHARVSIRLDILQIFLLVI